MTEYIYHPVELLDDFCMTAFKKLGFKKSECRIITDVLIMSDKYGIESHGMQRLVRYHKGIEKGLIDANAKLEIVHQSGTTAVIDAHDAMGQLAGHKAMELAIKKAKKTGVGIVSVKNSNHFGIAGYYAKMACDAGLIGMAFTNSEAIMVPTFGKLAMLGSNPIAIAMPAEPYDFFFDASTTVVTKAGRSTRTVTHLATLPTYFPTSLQRTAAVSCLSAATPKFSALTRVTATA